MRKRGMENAKRAPRHTSTRRQRQERRAPIDKGRAVTSAVSTTQPRAGRRARVGTVYLLHFSKPYRHARHYAGFTQDLARRLKRHRWGRGSPLVRAVVMSGLEFFLARRWDNVTVAFERRLHNWSPSGRKCPICSGKDAYRMCVPRRDPVTGVGR